MSTLTLPTVWGLTRGQRNGSRCVWCGRRLGADAVRAGVARGYWGAHDLSVAVYACPARHCLTETPSTGDQP